MALFDAFIKIDGIDGESMDKTHEKWIEVISFNWGVAAANISSASGGGGAGKVSPHAFSFMKLTDSASPEIFIKSVDGGHVEQVSLACRKAGGDAAGAPSDDFIKIDFFGVLFTSFTEGGHTATDAAPIESVSFAFQKVVFGVVATPVAGQTGNLVSESWNFAKNQGG